MNRLARRAARNRPRPRIGLERLEWRHVLSGVSLPVVVVPPPAITIDLSTLAFPSLPAPGPINLPFDLLTVPSPIDPAAGPFPTSTSPGALSVLATDPADGSRVTAPPTSLTIRFDRPIDPSTIGTADFKLDQVAPDGSLSPVFGPSAPPTEALDPTGFALLVTPPAPLGDGSYRLSLAGQSMLAGLDGSGLDLGDGDERLADFTIDASINPEPPPTVTINPGGTITPPVVVVPPTGTGGTIVITNGGAPPPPVGPADPGTTPVPSATNTLAILATSPVDGALLDQSLASLTVRFDRPLNLSVAARDIILERVADDGGTTPVFDEGDAPAETLDAPGTGIVQPLPAALPPGHYRIVLAGGAIITGLDGSILANAGADRTLADFTVERRGATLAGAEDLGPIGSSPTTVAGGLDFGADPNAVHLYKITLPAGHRWRLGAEVDAQRTGSPLDAALALFDARGHLIATDDLGRPDAPNDPYLFAGLDPGTYYLGVSGTPNLPDQAGGYDPLTGDPGSIAATGAGGPYTLQVVADPLPAAAYLIHFQLDRADAHDPTPTGFSLQFSGAIRTGDTGPSAFDGLSAGVVVRDASGRTWPVAAVGLDAATATVTYLFRDRLPAGRYTIGLPATGGLADLAGLAPTSIGLPAGVLATFQVGHAPGHGPNDLGALTPDLALDGIDRHVTLGPGETVAYRFVNLYDDLYQLGQQASGGPLAIGLVRSDDGSTTALDAGAAGSWTADLVHLRPGAYVVLLTNQGPDAIGLDWSIGIKSFAWEALIANGLGQGPALNLRLVAPAPAANGPATIDTAAANGPTAVATATASLPGPIGVSVTTSGPSNPSPTANPSGPSSGPTGPAAGALAPLVAHDFGPVATFSGGPIGRPNPGVDDGATGPMLAGRAATATGPGQSILGPTLTLGPDEPPGATAPESTPESSPEAGPAPSDGALIARAGAPEPDPWEMLELGWLEQIRPDWLTRLIPRADDGPATAEPVGAVDLAADLPAAGPEPVGLEQASLSSPLQVGLVVLLFIPARRLWRRLRRGRQSGRAPASAPRVPGPPRTSRPRGGLERASAIGARSREPLLEVGLR